MAEYRHGVIARSKARVLFGVAKKCPSMIISFITTKAPIFDLICRIPKLEPKLIAY